jgi:thiol:disulfide interchange protein DsbD
MAIFVTLFTIYLIPGLWGAPLKIISGFPPPMTYSESPNGIGTSSSNTTTTIDLPEHAHSGPHGIIAFHDYEDGLAYAKQINKPILLDFTGYACVNCRKMEDYVWSDKKILSILKNEVVLISFYVDENIDLPKSEQFISKSTGSEIVTVGDKWTDFMITKYKTNTQPLYVLINLDEQNLNKPISYTPNINDYLAWLKDGVSKFR